MSADKHRNLEIRAAYLRLAARDCGLGLNIKWARKLTPLLKRMAAEGELVLRAVSHGGNKTVTTAFITKAGAERLARAKARFGEEYGQPSAIDRIEPLREDKAMRRRRLEPTVKDARA